MIHFFVNSLEQIVLLVLSAVLSLSLLETAGKIRPIERRLQIGRTSALLGLLGNALMIFLLVWKLTPLFTQFEDIMAAPIMLLYAPGGIAGTFLGLIFALIYLLPWGKRRKSAWRDALGGGQSIETGSRKSYSKHSKAWDRPASPASPASAIRPLPGLILQVVIIVVLWSGLYSIMLRVFQWWSASRLGDLLPPG